MSKISIDGIMNCIALEEIKTRFTGTSIKDITIKIVIPAIIHDTIDLKDYELGKKYQSNEMKKFSFIIYDDFDKGDKLSDYKEYTAYSFDAPNENTHTHKICKVYYKEV